MQKLLQTSLLWGLLSALFQSLQQKQSTRGKIVDVKIKQNANVTVTLERQYLCVNCSHVDFLILQC